VYTAEAAAESTCCARMARLLSARSIASAASRAQTATMVAAEGTKPAGAVTVGSAKMPAPTVLPADGGSGFKVEEDDAMVDGLPTHHWHAVLESEFSSTRDPRL